MGRRSSSAQENLDPLLDTMANVVGILVVLVAVTQLSVTDAVERIRDQGSHASVTAEQVAERERALQAVETAVAGAEGELDAHPPSARRVGMLLETAEPVLVQLEALAGRAGLGDLDAADLEARIAQEEAKLAARRRAVEAEESQLLDLEDLVEGLPTEARPKIARLPDPRPVPPGMTEVAFFVRYGQVLPIDLEKMRAILHQGQRDALGVSRPLREDDRPWLINLFAKRRMGDEDFFWSLRDSQGRLFADVLWRSEDLGENRFEIGRRDSAYLAAVQAASTQRNFIRFYVWADSFEAYLEARYLAESRGYRVSWLPVSLGDEVGIDLQGGRQTRILID